VVSDFPLKIHYWCKKWGQNRRRGDRILTPNKLVFSFWASNVSAKISPKFNKNCDHRSDERQTEANDFIIWPCYCIAKGQITRTVQHRTNKLKKASVQQNKMFRCREKAVCIQWHHQSPWLRHHHLDRSEHCWYQSHDLQTPDHTDQFSCPTPSTSCHNSATHQFSHALNSSIKHINLILIPI